MAKKKQEQVTLGVEEVVENTTPKTFKIEVLERVTLAEDTLIYSKEKGTKTYDKGTKLECNEEYRERYSKFPRYIKFL